MLNQLNSFEDRFWGLLSKKLTNQATVNELSELDEMILANPDLQYQADLLSEMWSQPAKQNFPEGEAAYMNHLVNHKDEFFLEANAALYNEEIISEKQGFWGRLSGKQILSYSVLLIIAVSIFFLLNPSQKVEPPVAEAVSSVVTKNGNRTKIVLPDGSGVWLNAGSKLEYDKSFGKTIREVHLDGEAYFDVVKNPERPFIVKTHAANIKVLGTTFNVRSYPGDNKVETSLIRGSVEVTLHKRPAEKWVLKPNEKLVLLNDYLEPNPAKNYDTLRNRMANEPVIAIKRLTYQPGETFAVEAAWANNKLSFEDESFLEVSKKMERWYDVKFVFNNKKHEDLMMSGSFTSETIDQAMDALQYSFKFRFEIKNKEVTIY